MRKMVDEVFPDVQQILDYYHHCVNVYNYAKALFYMDESKCQRGRKSVVFRALTCELLLNIIILTEGEFYQLYTLKCNINNPI